MEDVQQQESAQLRSDKKNQIVQFLLQNYNNDVLKFGVQTEAAELYGVNRRTIIRLWNAAKDQMSKGVPVLMTGKVKGYHHKDKIILDAAKVRNLSVLERSTIRKMALKLDVSKSLVGEWVKEKQIRPHTSAIKPKLTEINKVARLRWSLSQLQPTNIDGKVKFHTMHNVVHIDEKWFYMTKSSDKYYLLSDEDEPYRSCKSKRFITKVMFMCAVCRPLFGANGSTLFDGKLGIFPFTTMEPAKRNSKNRSRGTLETKPIKSVTKAVIKECIIQRVQVFTLA